MGRVRVVSLVAGTERESVFQFSRSLLECVRDLFTHKLEKGNLFKRRKKKERNIIGRNEARKSNIVRKGINWEHKGPEEGQMLCLND